MKGSERIRPTLAAVHDPQDFDGVATQSIGGDVGRAVDDQFAGPCPPARPPNFREPDQPLDSGDNALNLAIGRARIVLSDIGPRGSQVADRRLSPDYPHFGVGNSSRRPHDWTHETTSS